MVPRDETRRQNPIMGASEMSYLLRKFVVHYNYRMCNICN